MGANQLKVKEKTDHGRRLRVFHKIKPASLESMRSMDENEKVCDIRVQDPKDDVKVYSTFEEGDILHFIDTKGGALRVILSKISAYRTVREALEDVGYKNAFPEAKNIEEAEEKCLSLGNYKDILKGQSGDDKPVYALWFMRYMFYVAGPYTARKAEQGTPEAEEERKANVKTAIHIGKDIMRLGYIPIVPHSLFEDWEHLPGLNEGLVIMAEKAAVARCEAFYRIAPSPGTNAEEDLARALNKDIFTELKQIHVWQPEDSQ